MDLLSKLQLPYSLRSLVACNLFCFVYLLVVERDPHQRVKSLSSKVAMGYAMRSHQASSSERTVAQTLNSLQSDEALANAFLTQTNTNTKSVEQVRDSDQMAEDVIEKGSA